MVVLIFPKTVAPVSAEPDPEQLSIGHTNVCSLYFNGLHTKIGMCANKPLHVSHELFKNIQWNFKKKVIEALYTRYQVYI